MRSNARHAALMKAFLEAIDERVLVCDGAMGTMLYAKGVFINRCFDALNLTEPDRSPRSTRTTCAPAPTSSRRTRSAPTAIKLRGVRPGRPAARDQRRGRAARAAAPRATRPTWPARSARWASASSRGARPGVDEAEAYFREQARGAARGRRRPVHPRDVPRPERDRRGDRGRPQRLRPADRRADDDRGGRQQPRRHAARAVRARRSSARGATSSASTAASGPAPMLETIERMATVTRARLSAQPNAGRPRDIEGRNIYLSSPEYMASYARRFMRHGVRLVGGCCGTTPEHIRQIKLAVQALRQAAGARRERPHGGAARRSRWRVAVSQRRRCRGPSEVAAGARAGATARSSTIVELLPPQGLRRQRRADRARAAAQDPRRRRRAHSRRPARRRAHERAVAGGADPAAGGIETVLQYSCRDRNLLGMQSDLLGAHAMGMRNVLLVTGDPRSVGDYPDATAVFDVDSIGLTNVVSRLNRGLDVGGQAIGRPRPSTSAWSATPAPRPGRRDPALRVQGRGGRRVRGDAAGVRPRGARRVPSDATATCGCRSSPACGRSRAC